jgi:hypothetical protein
MEQPPSIVNYIPRQLALPPRPRRAVAHGRHIEENVARSREASDLRVLAPLLMKSTVMQTLLEQETIDISLDDLDAVLGGAISAQQWSQIKEQAAQYCPATVQKYGNLDPAKITRGTAQQMANSCIAEMPGWEQGIARSKFNGVLDQAFPRK